MSFLPAAMMGASDLGRARSPTAARRARSVPCLTKTPAHHALAWLPLAPVGPPSHPTLAGTAAHLSLPSGRRYTGLAALALMGTLDRLPRPEATIGWCMGRQVGGFQGRPGKDEDTCYSFWIGASLALLGVPKMIHVNALCTFCNSCQFAVGGISKHAGAYPDVLHTHYAICGLALTGQPGLQPIDVRLGITARAAARHAPSCVECGDESAGTKCSLA